MIDHTPCHTTPQRRPFRSTSIGRALLLIAALVHMVTASWAQAFGDPQVLFVGSGTPIFMDADGDGLPEGFLQRSDSLYHLRNNGNGFDAPTLLTQLGPGTSVRALMDLDGNGELDVVFAHSSTDDQGVAHDSLGVIWLDATPVRTYLDSNGTANKVFIADMNGDLLPDVVYRNWWDQPINIHFSNGDRNFTSRTYPSTAGFGGVVLGFMQPYDWDGDGDTDLMGGIGLNGNLAVSYNIGGELGYPFMEVHAAINAPPQADIVDLNADGIQDYVTANNAYLRSPAGGMDITCCFAQSTGYRQMGNMDCDPAIEVVGSSSSDHGNGTVSDLLTWDWSITGFTTRRNVFDTTFEQFEMHVVDVNNDGLDDIAYRNLSSYDTLFYRINESTEPVVTLDPPSMVLPGDTVITLDWGHPAGGLYNGPGVFDNTLYVPLTNANALEITYSYSDPLTTCVGTASTTLQTAVGLRANTTNDGSTVFPNPANEAINFRSGRSGAVTLRIHDPIGRSALEWTSVHLDPEKIITLPITGLAPGLYYLSVASVSGELQWLPFLHTGAH